VVSFQDNPNPTPNCTPIKVYHIWRLPSHQLKLWMTEDELELTESVLVTKMKFFQGVVSCLLFFSLISSRLEVFQICEWLNQGRSLRRADHGGKINKYNLMFMDPCITVQFIKRQSNKMQKYIKIFYYFIFIWSSTCFGRNTAHHQEPKTAWLPLDFHKLVDIVRHSVPDNVHSYCYLPR
jgi:hypothetical protein